MGSNRQGTLWIVGGCLLLAFAGCKKARPAPSPPPSPAALPASLDWTAENNRGVGLMEQFDFDGAAKAFEKISDHRDRWPDIAVNWGIALLNRRGGGDEAHAEAIFGEVQRLHPDNLRAAYCLGLIRLNAGDASGAAGEFRHVEDDDPSDPYPAYYLGQCLALMNRPELAISEYDRALRRDPLLRSAAYGRFQLLQQKGEPEKAAASRAEFQRLADDPRAELAEFKYTRMGKKAEAITIDVAPANAVAAPAGPLFADAAPLKILNDPGVHWRRFTGSGPRPTITAADIDGDGRVDLFISSALEIDGKIRNAILLQRDGGFELGLKSPLAAVTDVNAVVWGDFDNDGLTDVYFCRHGPNQLFRQSPPGNWQDITESAHASGGNFNTVDAAAVDADHDGDLDLFLIRSDGPTELLNNNLDGTFSAIGEKAGIAGDGRPAVGLLAADLNHDGLVDLIVLKAVPPNDVFINDGSWKYHTDPNFRSLQGSVIPAIAADIDGTGQVSLVAIHDGEIRFWRPDASGRWQAEIHPSSQVPLPSATTAPIRSGPIAIADLTGDGRMHRITSVANGWDSSPPSPSGSPVRPPGALSTWALANLDPTAGPSIIALPSANGSPLIWRPGPGRYPFAALSLSGRSNKSESMRSNASGVGVNIVARADSRWAAASTYRQQSGPGQSLQPISLGPGPSRKFEFLRLTWPDGLRQTELDIPAGKLTHISEVQRQTSSCPVIFAWDGKQYAFVTDCLGAGGIGFATGPGEYAPQRPVENVLFPAGLPQAKDGRMIVKIGEPMEEACYLDSVALVSYDLPPGWSMTLDERMAINDPQPTGLPRFYRKSLVPSRAINDRGQDITAAVTKVDGVAAEPGERDPRFIGFTKEHFVEMVFDRPLDGGIEKATPLDSRPLTPTLSPEYRGEGVGARAQHDPLGTEADLILLADGWIEYPYSQTMFAAWQAKAPYRAPTLEAFGTDGKWVMVLDQFGYPAGMPRQISVPIPRNKLPAGTTRLRLRTTQEIYWDRLAIAWAEPCPHAARRVLEMKSARLADVGFPFRTTGPQRQPHYDYSHRQPLWDTHRQLGWYTAFGPVEELLQTTDDACAIFGPGEEVELQFMAQADALPAGWNRHYVLELAGWCKDRDLYTKDGRTLEPMPAREGTTPEGLRQRDELHRKYNTRYGSGG